MPTYGYECTACSDQFETVQSIKDAPLTTCEKCGGSLKKLIYPIGIAFKGSGFYVNDYARKDGGSNGSSTTKSETKTETKSETSTTKSETSTSTPAPAAPAAASA